MASGIHPAAAALVIGLQAVSVWRAISSGVLGEHPNETVINASRTTGRNTVKFRHIYFGGTMKKRHTVLLVTYPLALLLALNVKAQGNSPLKLVQKIPMPDVQGRMDHIAMDVNGKRLLVPANGDNQNTIEVIDLKAGKRISSIPGLSKPQGAFYSTEFNRLFVTNSTDGTCKIFRGDTFKLI